MCKSSWFLSLLMPLAPPDVGLFRTPAAHYSSILSVIPRDTGRLLTEQCVVCMCPMLHDAQLLLICLRAGTFCECTGSRDVSEISPKPWCANILVLSSGEAPFWKKPLLKVCLPRLKVGTRHFKPSWPSIFLLFRPENNVLKWVMVFYHFDLFFQVFFFIHGAQANELPLLLSYPQIKRNELKYYR